MFNGKIKALAFSFDDDTTKHKIAARYIRAAILCFLLDMFFVFSRRKTGFFLEDLAKVCGRVKSAFHGDIRDLLISFIYERAGSFDLYHIQIRNERYAEIFLPRSAKVIL